MKKIAVLQLCSILVVVNSEAGAQSLRLRFPGPANIKPLPASIKQVHSDPYPLTGQKPQPLFQLPSINGEIQIDYLSPLTISAALEFIDEIVESQPNYATALQEIPGGTNLNSAIIVNTPLQISTQLTTPHSKHKITFRPQSQISTISKAPPQPQLYLTVPYINRIRDFRPKGFQIQPSEFYSKTHLVPPRVHREKEFRPSRPVRPQQPIKFNRPLPSSIFENSNSNRTPSRPRPLPTNIFSI